MAEKSFEIIETFITVNGKIIAIFQTFEEDFPNVKIGDLVKIIHPDKTFVEAKIAGIDYFSRQCFTEKSFSTIGFLFNDLSKANVPVGSKISFQI